MASVLCRFAPYRYNIQETRRQLTQVGQRQGRFITIDRPVMRACPVILQVMDV